MKIFKYLLSISAARRLLTALLFMGVISATGTTQAENTELTQRTKLGNVSASRGDGAITAVNSTTRNERAVTTKKARSKTNRVILCVILMSMLAFTLVNLIAASYTTRICSTCGYTGIMKAVILSEKPVINSVLVFLVWAFPLLRYYYSERGRFRCPTCRRTSTNVSVRSKLKNLNW